MEFVIETKNLTRKFGDLVAVDNLNIQVKEGEIFGFLGPNGAGKTTTISMFCTILKPTSGTATINGFDIIKNRGQVRKSIGIVFQDPSLDDRLTGEENLKMHAGLYGVPKTERKKRIEEVLEIVELKDRAKSIVRTYSGGMKRRLEIGRGLIHYPKILFLDEPTLGLDPQTRTHIWDYIRKLAKKEKITIMLTTHYMEEADELCDRIAIIDHGKIVALDTSINLKNSLEGDLITIECKNTPECNVTNVLAEKVKTLDFVLNVKNMDDKLNLFVKNGETAVPKILDFARENNIQVYSTSVRKPTLNDVFIKYTGREIREEGADSKEGMRERARMRR